MLNSSYLSRSKEKPPTESQLKVFKIKNLSNVRIPSTDFDKRKSLPSEHIELSSMKKLGKCETGLKQQ